MPSPISPALVHADKASLTEYRLGRYYRQWQVSLTIGLLCLLSFSITDYLQPHITSFLLFLRMFLGIPIIGAVLGLSFTVFGRSHWRMLEFFLIISITLVVLSILITIDYGGDQPWGLSTGMGALNVAVLLVFFNCFFPLTLKESFVAGAIVVSLYVLSLALFTTVDLKMLFGYAFNILEIYGISTAICYARDQIIKREYSFATKLEQDRENYRRYISDFIPLRHLESLQKDGVHVAESYGEVTILFVDIVGFTSLSAKIAPRQLVSHLNKIFSTFDRLASTYTIEKVKTIGDAYMGISGAPLEHAAHAENAALMALAMVQAIRELAADIGLDLNIRVGIHTGAVIGGVIGVNKFMYDFWGDTVNVASRMESTGEPGKIQVSEAVVSQLRNKFEFQERGEITIEGKDKMRTYFLLRSRHDALEIRNAPTRVTSAA